MKRRTLLQGIGASTAMAVGASTSATAAETKPDGAGSTHLSLVDDDGVRRIIPIGLLRNGLDSVEVTPNCFAECCRDCTCTPCACADCNGGGGGC